MSKERKEPTAKHIADRLRRLDTLSPEAVAEIIEEALSNRPTRQKKVKSVRQSGTYCTCAHYLQLRALRLAIREMRRLLGPRPKFTTMQGCKDPLEAATAWHHLGLLVHADIHHDDIAQWNAFTHGTHHSQYRPRSDKRTGKQAIEHHTRKLRAYIEELKRDYHIPEK